jgi:hypothetical protein
MDKSFMIQEGSFFVQWAAPQSMRVSTRFAEQPLHEASGCTPKRTIMLSACQPLLHCCK